MKAKTNIRTAVRNVLLSLVAGLVSGIVFVPIGRATDLTAASITATRLKVNAASVHSVLLTGAPSAAQNEYIWLDYGDWSNLPGTSSPTCDWGGNTCTVTTSVTDVGIQCTNAAGCAAGTVSASGITITNEASPGQMNVYISDNSYTSIGQAAVYIVDDDSVTVTSTVAPTITFDIDTAQTDTNSAAPYTVSLGTITTTDTRVSGATDGINYIWLDLATNATGGASVTVENANGTGASGGLVSTSVSGDSIQNTAAAVSNGNENYGICVVTVSASVGAVNKGTNYNGLTCTADTAGNTVAALSATTPDEIVNSNSAPVAGGRAQIAVQASIASTTPAHDDYTDTLTFIATGTF